MPEKKRRRKEVLVPGSLLPTPQPGRFHGVITATKLCEETGQQVALVALSDEKVKLRIPASQVQQYVLEQPGNEPKKGKRAASSGAQGGQRAAAAARSATPALPEGSQLWARREAARSNEDKPPADPQRSGRPLQTRISLMMAAASHRWALGTKLWLKMRGYCRWPVLMWSAQICRKKDIEQLLATYKQGLLLVRCYGEHSSMWVREAELEAFDAATASKFTQLKAWGRQHNKASLVESVVEEVESAVEDREGEVERVLEIEKQTLLSSCAGAECSQCQEEGAKVACLECERIFHTLCVRPPALRMADLPGGTWRCPFCGSANQVGEGCSEEVKELTVERMGLTPDWIIEAAAFGVFQLEPPSPERPYIKGLLDPCSNSMAAPNIPAEVLYDKEMNGLKLSNSWAGHLVLLNPPYTAAVQWRFVNRAIDEVENDKVPAVLLLCRNSTDTAYFQRLRPYPRVLLRRTNTQFKDYSKTPIGFGICIFAIAKSSCRDLYTRFFEAFADFGEPNIPIDKTIMRTDAFHELLQRLRQHAEEHYRDHWVQCSICGKWRIITYEVLLAAKDADWTCRQLRPPYTSCRTPQTRREVLGGRYAVLGADGDALEAAEKVDYSIPRLDLLVRQAATSGEEEQPLEPLEAVQEPAEDALEAAEVPAAGVEAATGPAAGPEAEAASGPPAALVPEPAISLKALAKFVKLPARPVSAGGGPEAPQVLSAIELARQARIAANQAFLQSLDLGSGAIAAGDATAVAGDSALVLSAARLLADKAALAQARAQVEHAKQHSAKAAVACAKEADRLRAALEANAAEVNAARACVTDAEAVLAGLEGQQQRAGAGDEAAAGASDVASDSGDETVSDEDAAPQPADGASGGGGGIAAALRASKSHLIVACPPQPRPQPQPRPPAMPFPFSYLASRPPGAQLATSGGMPLAAVPGTSLQAKLDLLPILTSGAFRRFAAHHPMVQAHAAQKYGWPAPQPIAVHVLPPGAALPPGAVPVHPIPAPHGGGFMVQSPFHPPLPVPAPPNGYPGPPQF